ncbi:MAG: sulfatase-like hydrolase/transferase [Oscillospiraceae bacterium]|nr:sulfatase-like hydrolase/transferase [Oscillospiraceae bacterium]
MSNDVKPNNHAKPRGKLDRLFRPIRRNRLFLLVYLWLALAVPELVLHCQTSLNWGTLMSPGLLLGPLFALVPALAVFFLCTVLPDPKANGAVSLVYSVICLVLCGAQLVYYRVFGTFFSIRSMVSGTAALQFTHTIFAALKACLPGLMLMALPLLVRLTMGRLLFSFRPVKSWQSHALTLAACALLQIGLVLILPVFGGRGDTTVYGLYHHSSDSYLSVNKLGLFTAFRLDAQRFLMGEEISGSIVLESQPTEPPAQTQPPATVPEETEPQVTETTAPTEPPLNVLELDFNALAEQEDNAAVAEVHQYFASRTPSRQNEKTGLFEGCNLIMITAEGFSHLAVDPVRTPTLYRLMNEGFRFSEYYVPDWGVSTTDGEYAHLTGTIPKSGEWSFSASVGNLMPLTMVQQLIGRGYSAYAYHGHTYDYYDRNEYLENLGFEYKGYGQNLPVTWQWPESDVEVVDLSTGDYVNDTPFVTYYMTISGHREYNFNGNMMCYKNREAVREEPYSEHVRAYLACQLELEYSLQLLLERLEAAGVLENTVIVLTADHYPNGLTPEELGELLGHTPERNFEIFRNGCIIWKQGMEPEVVEAPASHLDILPTLSNLFGLEFDSRLYMGRDVFSDAAPLVMFRNRSWITDKAMYNADTGRLTERTEESVDDDYVNRIKNEVNNRFTVSARILDQDYWRKLFG